MTWTTSPAERQINRLKMLKRTMYGRANFDILRARVLQLPMTQCQHAIRGRAWFALMNWKALMGSLRSAVRTRPLPLPRYRAPAATAGSHG